MRDSLRPNKGLKVLRVLGFYASTQHALTRIVMKDCSTVYGNEAKFYFLLNTSALQLTSNLHFISLLDIKFINFKSKA